MVWPTSFSISINMHTNFYICCRLALSVVTFHLPGHSAARFICLWGAIMTCPIQSLDTFFWNLVSFCFILQIGRCFQDGQIWRHRSEGGDVCFTQGMVVIRVLGCYVGYPAPLHYASHVRGGVVIGYRLLVPRSHLIGTPFVTCIPSLSHPEYCWYVRQIV